MLGTVRSNVSAPVANPRSLIVCSVRIRPWVICSTCPVIAAGIAAVDRQLGDRLDLGFQVFDLGLEQVVVLPRLVEIGQPGTAGFEVGLKRLPDPGSVGRIGLLFQTFDPALQATDLGLDLVGAGVLEESFEHVLGIEHAQVHPEQAVEIGELELLERADRFGAGGLSHLLGDLAQGQAAVSQRLEATELRGGRPFFRRSTASASACARAVLCSWASTYR